MTLSQLLKIALPACQAVREKHAGSTSEEIRQASVNAGLNAIRTAVEVGK